MAGLDDYAIPHDPNSLHQLHWTPGKYGKGFLTPEGELHHWPTGDVLDGQPSHRHYMAEKGMGDIYGLGYENPHHMFWVHPSGEIESLNSGASWGDPNYKAHTLRRIQEIDPRLGPYAESWQFHADMRSQERELTWEERQQQWAEEAKLRRQEYEKDPIGYERTNSWDREGDVGFHRDIEWVPTHELKKFMEYDRAPGGQHFDGNVDRWQALRDHIVQHGFKNPVQLEFNPDTGHAHMGEGNHRTAIALAHGIPAMPVRVNRSRRSSETAIPVTLVPQPEWQDSHSDTGYRVPDSLKPSHIGLPTVPQPGSDWEFKQGKTSATTLYHVAPAHARESIMQHGLIGHKGFEDVASPWKQDLGQPAANYLFEHPEAARGYAALLAQKDNERKWNYPGDHPGDFGEHGVYVDDAGYGNVPASPGEDTSDWTDEQWDDFYDNREHEDYDHNNPEHRGLLPPHLQGYDVYKVMLHGNQVLEPDPEVALDKQRDFSRTPPKPHMAPSDRKVYLTPEEAREDVQERSDGDWDQYNGDFGGYPRRWMTRDHVPPHQLALHEHIPAFQINDLYADDTHEQRHHTDSPEVFHRIDPAILNPPKPRPYDDR